MSVPIIPVGVDGKVFYLSSARTSWSASVANNVYTGTAPTSLVEMTCIRNVNIDEKSGPADVSTRLARFKLSSQALFEVEISLDIPWQPADVNFQALRNAHFGRTTIALAVLDGPATSGSQGLWADFAVMDFPREEPIDKEMLCKCKIMPGPTLVPPQWVVAS